MASIPKPIATAWQQSDSRKKSPEFDEFPRLTTGTKHDGSRMLRRPQRFRRG
jgi:hypothetical protein